MRISRLLSFAAAVICCAGTMTAYADTAKTIPDEIHGISGTVFSVERPDASALTVVNAADFGLSADAPDNTQAMRDAFGYCRDHSGTKLVIEPGVYHFSPEEDIYLKRLQDVMLDAQGAEFIFSTPHYFKIYACDNVELRNLVVDWDWDTLRLGSVVKIENENDADNTLEIEFTELEEVDADIPLLSFMQSDPVDLVAGVHGSFKKITLADVPATISECPYKADKDGVTCLSPRDRTSIKDYAQKRIEKSTKSSFKKLMVDMLNYGAASQIHFNKNTANLANADLTEAQLAFGTQGVPELESCEETVKLSGYSIGQRVKSVQETAMQ